MLRRLNCFLFYQVLAANVLFAQNILVSDDFTGEQLFFDNSKLTLWASYTQPTSAFEIRIKSDEAGLSYPALQLTDTARAYSNYHSFSNSTKALTCIDYHFGVFDRSNDTMWIEYDIIWEKMTNSGEAGRINAIVLHQYPSNGAKFGEVDSIISGHPFGRPAYYYRIRNRNPALGNGFGFMGYGGNNDPNGKLYIHVSGGIEKHWLPGAVPFSGNFPPSFPDGGAVDVSAVASATEWRRVIWGIFPNSITLSYKKSGSNDTPTLVSTLPTAQTSNAPAYNYFNNLEAFRIYLYGASENIYVANLKISATSLPTTVTSPHSLIPPSIYPNPSDDYIELRHNAPSSTAQIITLEGKILQTVPLLGKKNASIFVGNLLPGMYLLSIQSKAGTSISKLIKK